MTAKIIEMVPRNPNVVRIGDLVEWGAPGLIPRIGWVMGIRSETGENKTEFFLRDKDRYVIRLNLGREVSGFLIKKKIIPSRERENARL